MELRRLQELAGMALTLTENLDNTLETEILEEATFTPPEAVQNAADKVSAFKPKLYAQEIGDVFKDFEKHKDEKKLQRYLLKIFKDEILPDTKRTIARPIIPSPHKPRALVFVIESPVQALVVKTLLAKIASELKGNGVNFSVKIDSKNLNKDYASEPQSTKQYTFELALYTNEELKASKHGAQQQKNSGGGTSNAASQQAKGSTEAEDLQHVESIFKRTTKFKHPNFARVKKHDPVVEEYLDKVRTTIEILRNFKAADTHTLNSIARNFKGADATAISDEINKIQKAIDQCHADLNAIYEPALKVYEKF